MKKKKSVDLPQRLRYNLKRKIVKRLARRGPISTTKILPCANTKDLGQEVETDDGLEWRVKWGQRGAAVSGLLAVICYIANQNIVAFVFGALMFIFLGIIYYKNVSFVIAKRLLGEPNVVIIIVLSLCVVTIDVARPATSLSPVNGLVFMC